MGEVLVFLHNIHIEFEFFRHSKVYTTDDADEFVRGMDGVLSKTLFMDGKKDRNFYLFVMDEKQIKKMSNMFKIIETLNYEYKIVDF